MSLLFTKTIKDGNLDSELKFERQISKKNFQTKESYRDKS